MKKTACIAACFSVAAVALAACGGGGAGGGSLPSFPGGTPPSSTPSATGTASKSISAAVGGTISASLAGETVSVSVPPGAMPKDSTVTLNAYATAANVPKTFGRTGTFIGAFAIDTGGVPILKRLSVAVTPSSSIPSGNVLRLAMYGAKTGGFTDVDTATLQNGAIVNDDGSHYVGMSSAAGAAAPYVLYAIAPDAVSTPAPIHLKVTAASTAPYSTGALVQFTASGADANGNSYVYAPAYALDNAGLGKIAPSSSDPLTAAVQFANTQAAGNLIVTDRRTNATTKLAVAVGTSQRPTADGDSFSYAGTTTQTMVQTYPAPIPTATTSATVTQSVTVKGGQTFNGQSGLYDFVTNETDTTPLQTTITSTDAFNGLTTPAADGSSKYVQYGLNWQDDAGNTLSYTYPSPIVQDQLPETAGAAWSNSAAATILENDTIDSNGAAFFSKRIYNSDGSYTETSTFPPGYTLPGSIDHGTISQNSDGSGSYSGPFVMFGAQIGDITYSGPLPQPDGSYQVTFNVYQESNPTASSVPLVSASIPAWFSVPVTLYHENDIDNGSVALPSACGSASSIAANAMQIVQSITRTDTVLGYTDAQTTTSYTVPGFGVVCMQLSDVQTDYYDFNGDTQHLFFVKPYETITSTETLALQSGGTSVQSVARRNSTNRALTSSYITAGRAQFMRMVDRVRARRERAFISAIHSFTLHRNGGTR